MYIYIHILLHIIARLLLHLRLPLRLPQLHIGCISPIMFTNAGVSESVAQTIESMTCIVMNDAELRQNPGTLAASARTTTRRKTRTDHATVRRSTHQWRDSNRNRPESSSARHVRSGSSVHHQIGDNRTPAVLAQSTSYIVGWISPGTQITPQEVAVASCAKVTKVETYLESSRIIHRCNCTANQLHCVEINNRRQQQTLWYTAR